MSKYIGANCERETIITRDAVGISFKHLYTHCIADGRHGEFFFSVPRYTFMCGCNGVYIYNDFPSWIMSHLRQEDKEDIKYKQLVVISTWDSEWKKFYLGKGGSMYLPLLNKMLDNVMIPNIQTRKYLDFIKALERLQDPLLASIFKAGKPDYIPSGALRDSGKKVPAIFKIYMPVQFEFFEQSLSETKPLWLEIFRETVGDEFEVDICFDIRL